MDITIKNLKHLPSMSEETNAFTADVYVDGNKMAFAKNHGHGGETDIQAYTGQQEKLKEAVRFAGSLPPEKSPYGDLKMDLAFLIDLQVERQVERAIVTKLLAKLKKKCSKVIVVCDKVAFEQLRNGKVDSDFVYGEYKLKNNPASITSEQLKEYARVSMRTRLKPGEIILNLEEF